MRGLNRIVIVGRLGADLERKTGKSGAVWCTMSVATSRAQKKGDLWVEETDWHDVRVFGEEAERCLEHLHRGAIVAIEGSLIYDAWTDEHNQRRRSARIAASRVQFISSSRGKAASEAGTEADPTIDVPPAA